MEKLLQGIIELDGRIEELERKIINSDKLTERIMENLDVDYLADEVAQRIMNNAKYVSQIADIVEDRITDNVYKRAKEYLLEDMAEGVEESIKDFLQANMTVNIDFY